MPEEYLKLINEREVLTDDRFTRSQYRGLYREYLTQAGHRIRWYIDQTASYYHPRNALWIDRPFKTD